VQRAKVLPPVYFLAALVLGVATLLRDAVPFVVPVVLTVLLYIRFKARVRRWL